MHYSILLLTFLSVNLDFFFMLLFLLKRYSVIQVIFGYLLGNIVLLVASYYIGRTLSAYLPEWSLGLLGFLPIYMAFRKDDDSDAISTNKSPTLSVFITYLSVCAGCNLSIFLPILAGETFTTFLITLTFISLLTVIIVILIKAIGKLPIISTIMEKHGEKLMKICYVLIGLYVFWDSGLITRIVAML